MAIDPKLVSIKTASEMPTQSPKNEDFFFYYSGNVLKKAPMTEINAIAKSGIKGEATQTSSPTAYSPEAYPNGLFETYVVRKPLTLPNSWGFAVTQAELDANYVFFDVKNGVVSKEVSLKPVVSGRIDTWVAQAYSYSVGYAKQVFKDGKIWENNANTLSTDIPGISSKWVEKTGALPLKLAEGISLKKRIGLEAFNLIGYWLQGGTTGTLATYSRTDKVSLKSGDKIKISGDVSTGAFVLLVFRQTDNTPLYKSGAATKLTDFIYIATEDCYYCATTLTSDLANSYIEKDEKTLLTTSDLTPSKVITTDIITPRKIAKGSVDGDIINIKAQNNLKNNALKYSKSLLGNSVVSFWQGYSYVLPVVAGEVFRITAQKYNPSNNSLLIFGSDVNIFESSPFVTPLRITDQNVSDLELIIPVGVNFLTVTSMENDMSAHYTPDFDTKIYKVGIEKESQTYSVSKIDSLIQNTNSKILPFKIGAYPSFAGYDGQTINVDMVYDLWDTLLGVYDNPIENISSNKYQKLRVTKELRGRDQSNTYDIFAYTFEPSGYKKTVSITTCVHGTEKINTFSMFEIMKAVVNQTNQDFEVLDYIRKKVKIVIIPIVNPWGFNTPRYANSRYVNPIRNFPYYWSEYESNDSTGYDGKGTAPFSEAESVVIRDISIELRGELTFNLDFHTAEGGSRYPFIYYDAKDESGLKQGLLQAAERLIADFKKKYDRNPPIGNMEQSSTGLMRDWFNNCLGVPSVTIEVGPNSFESTVALSANQINGVVNMHLIYLSYLLAVNFTNRPQKLGIKRLTKSQYDNIGAKNYNTIYKTTDTSETFIGDVIF